MRLDRHLLTGIGGLRDSSIVSVSKRTQFCKVSCPFFFSFFSNFTGILFFRVSCKIFLFSIGILAIYLAVDYSENLKYISISEIGSTYFLQVSK